MKKLGAAQWEYEPWSWVPAIQLPLFLLIKAEQSQTSYSFLSLVSCVSIFFSFQPPAAAAHPALLSLLCRRIVLVFSIFFMFFLIGSLGPARWEIMSALKGFILFFFFLFFFAFTCLQLSETIFLSFLFFFLKSISRTMIPDFEHLEVTWFLRQITNCSCRCLSSEPRINDRVERKKRHGGQTRGHWTKTPSVVRFYTFCCKKAKIRSLKEPNYYSGS